MKHYEIPESWWAIESVGEFTWDSTTVSWAQELARAGIWWPLAAAQRGVVPPMAPGVIVGPETSAGGLTGGRVQSFDDSVGFLGVALDHPDAGREEKRFWFRPHQPGRMVERFEQAKLVAGEQAL